MFSPVDPKQSFPELEKKILKFWEKNKIFEKSVAQRKGRKKYVFFDGPPFANGLPHYGHILANAIKDAVTRYFTMKGYYVPRVNGWDCHGLPVEYEVEKELKISGRKQIEELGIAKFNEACRKSVFRYTKEWETLLKRIGRWVDFKNSYATLDTPYMESIWWVFKSIWDKDMIYSGHKSMHICPRCETPLSNFEVTQGYKDITDLSVIVKFRVKMPDSGKDDQIFLLAWTTTPWTLPGNVALAVNPVLTYVKVRKKDGPKNVYYLAAQGKFSDEYEIVQELSAEMLQGLLYEPLFDFFKGRYEKIWRVVTADFVTAEEGTGIVHIAPAFGEEDYQLAQRENFPILQHVKLDGTFTDDVKPWAGKFAKGQDLNIADDLEKRGLLFAKENIRHSYPHCWRCDTPLLNYATKSLFIKVTDIKNRLLQNNRKIHWQPSHLKDGRFGKWLEGARDWAISRNRYWGCSIPIWECECGEKVCIGSIAELKKYSKGKVPRRGKEIDLHRPYIDAITFPCKKCGGEMKRIPDVLDCWFESGSMPYAQLHYPFENRKEFEENFPANFIAEGLDQTRGWFYTLHVLSTILFNTPAFHNVIVNGILLAADGEKLSKRKKNYPDPNLLFETKGVDPVRYFLYSSTLPLADEVRFSEQQVDEILKNFLMTLWNSYSFFITYANIDQWKPEMAGVGEVRPRHRLDQWIVSELHTLIETMTRQMDDYNLTLATRPLFEFVDNLSNWYIRRSRRRFWKSENDEDKHQAYSTLYTVLYTVSELLAPFMPFIADALYQNLSKPLKNKKISVHLIDWPKAERRFIKPLLNEEIRIVRKIVTLGHSARSKAHIRVRTPLRLLQIGLPETISEELVKKYEDVILEELNVKKMEFVQDVAEYMVKIAKPDLKKLGPKLGSRVQQVIRLLREGKYVIQPDGRVKVGDDMLDATDVEIGFQGKEGFDVASEEGISVILDTEVTDELRHEWYSRELIRAIQEMRKSAGYRVSDRIYIWIDGPSDVLQAVTHHADTIRRETLAVELQEKGDFEWDIEKEEVIEQHRVKLGIRRSLT